MGISERQKEIKRRRHRTKRLEQYKKKLATATPADKEQMAHKLRELTPGAEGLIKEWGLE